MKKQKLMYFVAQTYINCDMEARVSVLCVAENGWEEYWGELKSDNIKFFETEEEAKKKAYTWANTDMTVHGKWIDV